MKLNEYYVLLMDFLTGEFADLVGVCNRPVLGYLWQRLGYQTYNIVLLTHSKCVILFPRRKKRESSRMQF
jgi:hypothetical protein